MRFFISILITLFASGCAVGKTPEPPFSVVSQQGEIEIREYSPMLVAEVTQSGERDKAINAGFRVLADYIFGNNRSQKKIAMTAPVTQQASEKIAMTAPVTQQSAGGDSWTIGFVMPAEYTLETLPVPVNAAITIKAVPSYKAAVIRFSGTSSAENLAKHKEKLEAWLDSSSYQRTKVPPRYAFYNPPWTLPWWRRNEVMFVLAD